MDIYKLNNQCKNYTLNQTQLYRINLYNNIYIYLYIII